jgi:phage host-nuclease inhibitor protein Gam
MAYALKASLEQETILRANRGQTARPSSQQEIDDATRWIQWLEREVGTLNTEMEAKIRERRERFGNWYVLSLTIFSPHPEQF